MSEALNLDRDHSRPVQQKLDAPRQTSQAVVLRDFGGVEQLRLQTVETPAIAPDEILVRVSGTSVNPIEWKMRQGLGLPRWLWRRILGKPMILGLDFSGSVAAVGADIKDFHLGEDIMGAVPTGGTYTEYLVVRPADERTAIARKPANLGHDIAGVFPFAGLVAYAGLVSHGGLDPSAQGARILIVGASGGVGHLATQMAKHGLQASFVAAVSSSRNEKFVRECGADQVIAHDLISVTDIASHYPQWAGTFDLIFDAVGIDAYYTSVAKILLKPTGRYVSAALPQNKDGSPGEDRSLLGGVQLLLSVLWRSARGRYRLIGGLIGELPSKSGFPVMARWLAEGKVLPRITARYPLASIGKAHRESEGGRTVGKIAISVP